ncbi:MAG: methyltransferase, partial [Candidatus Sedimenticola sp. 6PFRAG7]
MTGQKLDPATTTYLDKLRQDIVFTESVCGQQLTYHTTWGLFSPKNVDEGSRLLLDYLEINETDDTLDLGCGYGPLGLTMARLAPKGTSVLVDKDFMAVEYSRKNAQLNNIENVEVFL